jgi:hypothetical protein
VWVDGVEVSGVTPLTAEVTAGQAHTLMVARPGFVPSSTTLAALQTADFTERTVSLRSGGKAQFKACAAQAGTRASALEKKGSVLEAAAKRAEATWCEAQLSIKR